MSGDPKECRAHARRCSELAAAAKEPRLKRTLSHLAVSWTKLTTELETAQALRAQVEDKQNRERPNRRKHGR
jgi:hypothetical protein